MLPETPLIWVVTDELHSLELQPAPLPVLCLMISAGENSTVPRIILREKSAITTVVLCHPIEERTICK